MNYNNIWSKNINYLRIAYGWLVMDSIISAKAFAKILNVTETTYSSYWSSKGRVPSYPQLDRLSQFFSTAFNTKITPANLIGDDIRDILKLTPVPPEILELDNRMKTKLNEVQAMLFDRVKDLTYEDLLKVEEIIDKISRKE